MNDVDLICCMCQKYFSSKPITLPCGWAVCESHVISNECRLNCMVCEEAHEINLGNCIYSKNLGIKYLKYISQKNETYLIDQLDDFEKLKNDPYNYVYQYFESLINKIDQHREAVINSVNDYFFRIIDDIKQTRDNLKELAINNKSIKNLNTTEIKAELDKMNESINNQKNVVELEKTIKQQIENVS